MEEENNDLTRDSAMEEESEIAEPARGTDSITSEPDSDVQQDALIDDGEPDHSVETEPERRSP